MRGQIRAVKSNGSLGEFMPDAKDVEFLDDAFDVGTVTFTYPERTGRNAELLLDRQEPTGLFP